MHQPQHDEDVDYEFDSSSDSDQDNLFDSDDEASSDTDLESLLEEVDNNPDDDDDLFNDEIQHPPEYYIAKSNNLDVGRLRQKHYSLKTQDRPNWVKEHYEQYVACDDSPCLKHPANSILRYCTFIRRQPAHCFHEVS
jgi:hypothetical protein